MILPVILCGGSGTRLWPLSRECYPKQFLQLGSSHSLLQETLLRLETDSHQPALLICNEEHRFICAEQVRAIGYQPGGIILEPQGRNTAPAIALAALKVRSRGEDPVLLVLASDHYIGDVSAFRQSVNQGLALAHSGKLVTFGITPDSPHSGYGYIQCGSPLKNDIGQVIGAGVTAFVEKPDVPTAQRYLDNGNYLWNSGMFLFKASDYLDELALYRPDILQACEQAMAQLHPDLDFTRINRDAFLASPAESIDYAVMEHTERAAVVPMNASWNDIGSFEALWQTLPKDTDRNVHLGDVTALDSQDNLVITQDRLVATVGVQDLVVVDTKDTLLVAHRSQSQAIKSLVDELKSRAVAQVTEHREVYRPWGKYDIVDRGERFLVKRITVRPGHSLSRQLHYHRAEHWVVVSGTAAVEIGEERRLLSEDQSVFIPATVVHRLSNPGKVDLQLIEVQSGSYLEEDDIVRFEDDYTRGNQDVS
ncbi:mannose-1-phosphate guanylyltransferase/mannose-6-phosphate isomerase [Pseudoalteromonas sp. R3]|uniref:mannose-1-phosphate guanylyltransferase/mannose-6-phosphate isomerase n=1 Tax=Pseudoalteromonas sp. R3 TaxID=1709477 RepID=UPI0006B523EE|nr:mannose-1-phosphate guanylyltransferase/mannose-6-phosphate isomerase [Pseudoalteromonas sp. R3]AZZ99227.1 mannose-1-phosphate guanylyltransferase/mannose-6-phosphate isomerase [Pseudoalteromonas sp. R3]